MKRFINIIIGIAAMVIVPASCQKEEQAVTMDPSLVGEWHLTEITAEGIVVSEGIDCYLLIASDCTFELYQQSGTQTIRYEKYTGTCTYENEILSGYYSNGKPWGGKYLVSANGENLTLSSYNLLEVQKYKKAVIPEDVKKNANAVHTKSGDILSSPIL